VFDMNTVMAGIGVLTAFALTLEGAVGRIKRRLMVWQPRGGETEKL
jgi:NitT/TauT family transport system permease protein